MDQKRASKTLGHGIDQIYDNMGLNTLSVLKNDDARTRIRAQWMVEAAISDVSDDNPFQQERLAEDDAEKTLDVSNSEVCKNIPDLKDLSGTVFRHVGSSWSLGKLLTREFHFDLYSLALSNANPTGEPSSIDQSRYRVRVYSFDDIPASVAKLRYRNMKRMSKYRLAMPPNRHDGRLYLPYLVDIDQVSGHNPKREESRFKQRERRQRKRDLKKSMAEEDHQGANVVDPGCTRKRHRLSPLERSTKFILGLYDFDNPEIDPEAARSWIWDSLIKLSATIFHARFVDTAWAEFNNESEGTKINTEIHTKLAFLRRQWTQVPKVRKSLVKNYIAGDNSSEALMNILKLGYAFRILPRLIRILESKGKQIKRRLVHISRGGAE